MYKPANIREFVTKATQKRTSVEMVNGRTQKVVGTIATIRGKFKIKGTTDMNANGLYVVNDKTTFTTWWKDDFKAGDIFEINGIDWQVRGEPENVEMRGRYAILTLERIGGGA